MDNVDTQTAEHFLVLQLQIYVTRAQQVLFLARALGIGHAVVQTAVQLQAVQQTKLLPQSMDNVDTQTEAHLLAPLIPDYVIQEQQVEFLVLVLGIGHVVAQTADQL